MTAQELLKSVDGCADFGDNDRAETTSFEVGECLVLPSETALPARVVSAAPPQSREGVSVPENVWFKHWAKKSLGSNDLNSLTDHEERVWWRFLSVASAEDPRWHVRVSPKLTLDAIAYSCHSTVPKLRAALSRFQAMGMLTAIDGGWMVSNWEKHQETPEARRQRLKRDRDRDMSRDSNGSSNAFLLREEEQRTDLLSTKVVVARPPRKPKAPKEHKPMTDAQRAKVNADFAHIPHLQEEIEFALTHDAYEKSSDDNAYIRHWLRGWRGPTSKPAAMVIEFEKPRGITVPDMGFRE